MRIESAVAKGALMRQTLIFLVPLILGGWFAYDGWIGYPKKNMAQAKGEFPVVPAGSVPQTAAVTQESAKDLQAKIGADPSRQITLTDVDRVWGEPAYLGPAEAGGGAASNQRVAFYVGPYGWAKVALTGDAVTGIEWNVAEKDYSAVAVQKLLAAIGIVLAMIPLGVLLGMVSGKYVLDDEGLTVPGRKRISYEQMTDLDVSALQRGLVRVKYRNQKGQEASVVLDEEKIGQFDEIVLSLCEKKGWREQLEKAVESADLSGDAA